jgi:Fic family protein
MTETFFKIEQPPTHIADASDLLNDPKIMQAVKQAQAKYLPWKEFRYKSWVPSDKQKVWAIVKLVRQFNCSPTPITDAQGRSFTFDPRSHVQFLHKVDLELGGSFLGIEDFSESDKRRFIRRALIEESIASSQLEGANTSRAVAKKMLKEGREPRNKDEKMIVNNHSTMQWIEQTLQNEELTIQNLKELHTRITWKTIDARHQGVLRDTFDSAGNPLTVKPWDDRRIAYVAPSREFVEQELPKFFDFANDKDAGPFVHPLIKAIMIHFWIGLLHPFEDGNGRLARVLFYWYMLRHKYWAFSYLSISERIKKSPTQYAMAYIYSEQDANDLNYFIWYNVTKIRLARIEFEKYVKTKIRENRRNAQIIRSRHNINERQLDLIHYLAKDEQRYTTLGEYLNVNEQIGKVTASNDLRKLVEGGLLEKRSKGRSRYYYPLPELFKLAGRHSE